MKRTKKIISAIILICFIFNTALSDFAFAQQLNYVSNTDRLAAALRCDDLNGPEINHEFRIRVALLSSLLKMAGQAKTVDLNLLPKLAEMATKHKDTISSAPDLQFFPEIGVQIFPNEMKALPDGHFRIMCRVTDPKNPRKEPWTYYAVIASKRDADGGFPIYVYKENEYDRFVKYDTLRNLPKRSQEHQYAAAMHVSHEISPVKGRLSMDEYLAKKADAGEIAVNEQFHPSHFKGKGVPPTAFRKYGKAKYVYSNNGDITKVCERVIFRLMELGINSDELNKLSGDLRKKPLVIVLKNKNEDYPVGLMPNEEGMLIPIDEYAHSSDNAVYIIAEANDFAYAGEPAANEPSIIALKTNARSFDSKYFYETTVHFGLLGKVDRSGSLNNIMTIANNSYEHGIASDITTRAKIAKLKVVERLDETLTRDRAMGSILSNPLPAAITKNSIPPKITIGTRRGSPALYITLPNSKELVILRSDPASEKIKKLNEALGSYGLVFDLCQGSLFTIACYQGTDSIGIYNDLFEEWKTFEREINEALKKSPVDGMPPASKPAANKNFFTYYLVDGLVEYKDTGLYITVGKIRDASHIEGLAIKAMVSGASYFIVEPGSAKKGDNIKFNRNRTKHTLEIGNIDTIRESVEITITSQPSPAQKSAKRIDAAAQRPGSTEIKGFKGVRKYTDQFGDGADFRSSPGSQTATEILSEPLSQNSSNGFAHTYKEGASVILNHSIEIGIIEINKSKNMVRMSIKAPDNVKVEGGHFKRINGGFEGICNFDKSFTITNGTYKETIIVRKHDGTRVRFDVSPVMGIKQVSAFEIAMERVGELASIALNHSSTKAAAELAVAELVNMASSKNARQRVRNVALDRLVGIYEARPELITQDAQLRLPALFPDAARKQLRTAQPGPHVRVFNYPDKDLDEFNYGGAGQPDNSRPTHGVEVKKVFSDKEHAIIKQLALRFTIQELEYLCDIYQHPETFTQIRAKHDPASKEHTLYVTYAELVLQLHALLKDMGAVFFLHGEGNLEDCPDISAIGGIEILREAVSRRNSFGLNIFADMGFAEKNKLPVDPKLRELLNGPQSAPIDPESYEECLLEGVHSIFKLGNFEAGKAIEVITESATVRSWDADGEILWYPDDVYTPTGGIPSVIGPFSGRVRGGMAMVNGKVRDLNKYRGDRIRFDQKEGGNALQGIQMRYRESSYGLVKDPYTFERGAFVTLTTDAGQDNIFKDIYEEREEGAAEPTKKASAKIGTTYVLIGDDLTMMHSVKNDGEVDLPYHASIHPWSLKGGAAVTCSGTPTKIYINDDTKHFPIRIEDVPAQYNFTEPKVIETPVEQVFTGFKTDEKGWASFTITAPDGRSLTTEFRTDDWPDGKLWITDKIASFQLLSGPIGAFNPKTEPKCESVVPGEERIWAARIKARRGQQQPAQLKPAAEAGKAIFVADGQQVQAPVVDSSLRKTLASLALNQDAVLAKVEGQSPVLVNGGEPVDDTLKAGDTVNINYKSPLYYLVDPSSLTGQHFYRDNYPRDRRQISMAWATSRMMGLTTNLSIFQTSAESGLFDQAIEELVSQGITDPAKVYDDVTMGAFTEYLNLIGAMTTIGGHALGTASYEVPPHLIHNVKDTVSYQNLITSLNPKAVMVKSPSTAANFEAVRQNALAENVVRDNMTLMFGFDQWLESQFAQIEKLEQRVRHNKPIDDYFGVDSFFLSRTDILVNTIFGKLIENGMLGAGDKKKFEQIKDKVAVAQAKIVGRWNNYVYFGKGLPYGTPRPPQLDMLRKRFENLKKQIPNINIRSRIPLWASTQVKQADIDRHVDPLLYFVNLIGPDTVNTMPDGLRKAIEERFEGLTDKQKESAIRQLDHAIDDNRIITKYDPLGRKTEYAEGLTPERIIRYANDLFDRYTNAILDIQGTHPSKDKTGVNIREEILAYNQRLQGLNEAGDLSSPICGQESMPIHGRFRMDLEKLAKLLTWRGGDQFEAAYLASLKAFEAKIKAIQLGGQVTYSKQGTEEKKSVPQAAETGNSRQPGGQLKGLGSPAGALLLFGLYPDEFCQGKSFKVRDHFSIAADIYSKEIAEGTLRADRTPLRAAKYLEDVSRGVYKLTPEGEESAKQFAAFMLDRFGGMEGLKERIRSNDLEFQAELRNINKAIDLRASELSPSIKNENAGSQRHDVKSGQFDRKPGSSDDDALYIFARHSEVFFNPNGFATNDHEKYVAEMGQISRTALIYSRRELIKQGYINRTRRGYYVLTGKGMFEALSQLVMRAHEDTLGTITWQVLEPYRRNFYTNVNILLWFLSSRQLMHKVDNFYRITPNDAGRRETELFDKAWQVAEKNQGFVNSLNGRLNALDIRPVGSARDKNSLPSDSLYIQVKSKELREKFFSIVIKQDENGPDLVLSNLEASQASETPQPMTQPVQSGIPLTGERPAVAAGEQMAAAVTALANTERSGMPTFGPQPLAVRSNDGNKPQDWFADKNAKKRPEGIESPVADVMSPSLMQEAGMTVVGVGRLDPYSAEMPIQSLVLRGNSIGDSTQRDVVLYADKLKADIMSCRLLFRAGQIGSVDLRIEKKAKQEFKITGYDNFTVTWPEGTQQKLEADLKAALDELVNKSWSQTSPVLNQKLQAPAVTKKSDAQGGSARSSSKIHPDRNRKRVTEQPFGAIGKVPPVPNNPISNINEGGSNVGGFVHPEDRYPANWGAAGNGKSAQPDRRDSSVADTSISNHRFEDPQTATWEAVVELFKGNDAASITITDYIALYAARGIAKNAESARQELYGLIKSGYLDASSQGGQRRYALTPGKGSREFRFWADRYAAPELPRHSDDIFSGSEWKGPTLIGEGFESTASTRVGELTHPAETAIQAAGNISSIDIHSNYNEALAEINEIAQNHATNAGMEIPTPENTRYTLLVNANLYKDGDLKNDRNGITPEGEKIAGFADRFDVLRVNTSSVDNILGHINVDGLDPKRVVVQLSGPWKEENIRNLMKGAPGIKFVHVDTTGFNSDANLNDNERQLCRFDLYTQMLLVRRITKEDIEKRNSLYMVLEFFLKTHSNDVSDAFITQYMNSIVAIDIAEAGKLSPSALEDALDRTREAAAFLINHNLSYMPTERWRTPDYHQVALTMMSA